MGKISLFIKNYAWKSVDSCSDHKYIKKLTAYFKVVMYSNKSFDSYPRNYEHSSDFQRISPWFTCKKGLPICIQIFK